MRVPLFACVLLLIASSATAKPIPSDAIQVIDGDTISARGRTVRLVGFDTPEAGMNAVCEAERTLAVQATSKLRQLVAGGGLQLSLVPCACPPGTDGTQACNYGRSCGVLKAAGHGSLARSYLCSDTRCPRRELWC